MELTQDHATGPSDSIPDQNTHDTTTPGHQAATAGAGAVWMKSWEQKLQKHSTRGSRVIPQHSTNLAQTRLTSEIGRDRVLSGWYDRAMLFPKSFCIYSMPA